MKCGKGTLALSWGPYGGFYRHPHRVCLGWVAITILNVEIDDLMHAYVEACANASRPHHTTETP